MLQVFFIYLLCFLCYNYCIIIILLFIIIYGRSFYAKNITGTYNFQRHYGGYEPGPIIVLEKKALYDVVKSLNQDTELLDLIPRIKTLYYDNCFGLLIFLVNPEDRIEINHISDSLSEFFSNY